MIEEWDYNNLLDRQRTSPILSGSADSSTASPEKFMLNAYVDKIDKFRLIDSSVVKDLDTTPTVTKSMYSLVFFRRGKKILKREPLPVEFESPFEKGHAHAAVYHYDAFVHVVRPMPANTVAIEVQKGDHVLWHLDRQTTYPTVKIHAFHRKEASPEQSGNSETLSITWAGSHPKGAKLTYSVFYSADEGKTWMAIGTGMEQASLNWNLRGAPGSDKAIIRVTASDGFNTASDASETFRVQAKPPTVTILPSTYKEWPANRAVRLRGVGFDLQDGVLPGAAMQWSSDPQGELGTGSVMEHFLRPGSHLITLRATNTHGLTSTTQETIVVTSEENMTDHSPVPSRMHSAH